MNALTKETNQSFEALNDKNVTIRPKEFQVFDKSKNSIVEVSFNFETKISDPNSYCIHQNDNEIFLTLEMAEAVVQAIKEIDKHNPEKYYCSNTN